MPVSKPQKITLRTYQVGFGDCFLLSFHYASKDKHVLIDFGSTGTPPTAGAKLLPRVATKIREHCGGKLHAVIATHRHADHISGFATNAAGTAPGNIIADCQPDVVLQPWTEHPDADPDTGAIVGESANNQAFSAALHSMHGVSQAVLDELKLRRQSFGNALFGQLSFLGEDNLSNLSAVNNLMEMGRNGDARYLRFGDKSGLERVLPGVKVHVLGPPDLTQTETIRKERSKDEAEFWHLQAHAGGFVTQRKARLFRSVKPLPAGAMPPHTRWFIERCRKLRGDQLLGIMRALDNAMNNTSLILLFEVGGLKLLFPGDAQIENWAYALSKPEVLKLLKDVNVYKVGHHGSLNATPKTLWNNFRYSDEDPDAACRLQTFVSTMAGKHGKESNNTEVPRRPLIKTLKAKSKFFTTQDLTGKDDDHLFEVREFEL